MAVACDGGPRAADHKCHVRFQKEGERQIFSLRSTGADPLQHYMSAQSDRIAWKDRLSARVRLLGTLLPQVPGKVPGLSTVIPSWLTDSFLAARCIGNACGS
jgi:hypothetical protein